MCFNTRPGLREWTVLVVLNESVQSSWKCALSYCSRRDIISCGFHPQLNKFSNKCIVFFLCFDVVFSKKKFKLFVSRMKLSWKGYWMLKRFLRRDKKKLSSKLIFVQSSTCVPRWVWQVVLHTSSTLHQPHSTKQEDVKTSKLALTPHFPVQIQDKREKGNLCVSPCLFHFQGEFPPSPWEQPQRVVLGRGGGASGVLGGCSALPKQTIQQTNNYTLMNYGQAV